MASSEVSSVVFSVRQLLDAETERVLAEQAEHEARLAQERLEAANDAAQRREYEWHQRLSQEANLLKARLVEQSELALAATRGKLEREYQMRAAQRELGVSALTGRHRMLLAALVTLVVGAGLVWLFVVLPGQRRASDSYASLSNLYTTLLSEQQARADAWSRERRQLKTQIESILSQPKSMPHTDDSSDRAAPSHTKPPPHWHPGVSVPPCTCLRGDPLCDC
jgi:hypothetical protein